MATAQVTTVPENTTTPQLLNISHQNILKLTSTNYLVWKLQIEATFIGYDLIAETTPI